MAKRSAILLGALALLYIALRFWRLADSCLWFDEIFSVHAAEHPWGEIIPFIAKDLIHPPLFYLVLKIWIGIGGENVFWLRLLPVIFSILALFPLWMLCREIKLRPNAVIVAFGLFTVNGALIKYAQEVRMYSLLLFLSLMSIWLFSRYYFRGKSFWVLVVVNVLLVYTHYFGWFVVITQVLAILIAQRIKILQTLLMLGVTVGAFVPWVFALLRFAEDGSSVKQNIGWMQSPGVVSLFQFALDLVDPFFFQQSSMDSGANYLITIPLILLIVTAKVLYLSRLSEEPNKERYLFLSIFAAFPIFIVFVLSWALPVSLWGSRHLLIVFSPIMLLISIYVTEAAPPVLRKVFLSAAVLLVSAAFVMQAITPTLRYSWCSWEAVAREFSLYRGPDENLYAFEDLSAYHLWFSLRSRPNANMILIKETGLAEDPAYFLPRGFNRVQVTNKSGITGEWVSFAFRAKDLDETKPPLSLLTEKGYAIVETFTYPSADSNVYLVRATRKYSR